MQVAVEGGFAADADGFALGRQRSGVTPPGCFVQPGAVGFAKVFAQPIRVACGQVTNGVDAL
jgi:hypothetical protein